MVLSVGYPKLLEKLESGEFTIRYLVRHAEEIRIHFGGFYCNFEFEEEYDQLHISNGSFSLIGMGDEFVVQIKTYTIQEFLTLLKDKNPDHLFMKFPTDFKVPQVFNSIQVVRTLDYGAMITRLEKDGSVKTRPSNNILASDPREFKILDDNEEDVWWHVDCLGVNTFSGLTKQIETMFKKLAD